MGAWRGRVVTGHRQNMTLPLADPSPRLKNTLALGVCRSVEQASDPGGVPASLGQTLARGSAHETDAALTRYGWALILAALALYAPVIKYGFVNYDDPFFVKDNPYVSSGLSPVSIRFAVSSFLGFYHPVTWLSLILDQHLFGHNASAFHLTNIWLHALNAVLVFKLAWRISSHKYWAFGTALLFVVHPANVESVAWISERKGLLSAFFFLAALTSYQTWLERGCKPYLLLGMAAYVLSLLSKPNHLVMFPVLLTALYFWNRRQANRTSPPPSAPGQGKAVALATVCAVALSTIAGLLTIGAERKLGALRSFSDYSLEERIAMVPVFYVKSLSNSLLPSPISPVDLWRFPGVLPVLGASVVLTILTVLFVRLWRRRPFLILAWTWFVCILLPMSGIFKHADQLTAHRYLYMPIVGVMGCILWLLIRLVRNSPSLKYAVIVSVGLWVVAYSAYARSIMGIWRDSTSLWTYALAHTDGNFVAANNLAVCYIEAGQVTSAQRLLRSALACHPDYYEAYYNLGITLAGQEKHRQALVMFGRAERLEPKNCELQALIARVYTKLGNLTEATNRYEKALSYDARAVAVIRDYARMLAEHCSAPAQLERSLELDEAERVLVRRMNQGRETDYSSLLRSAATNARLQRKGLARELAFRALLMANEVRDGEAAPNARRLLNELNSGETLRRLAPVSSISKGAGL